MLRTWIHDVIQAVDPWMSDKDIQAGARWDPEVARGSVTATRETPQNKNRLNESLWQYHSQTPFSQKEGNIHETHNTNNPATSTLRRDVVATCGALRASSRAKSKSNTASGAYTGIPLDHGCQRQAGHDGRISELHEKHH